jgi:hypothetical protein
MLRNTVECERTENLEILNRLVGSSKTILIESNVCVYCRQIGNQSFLAFPCSHLAHIECADENGRNCLCLKNPTLKLKPNISRSILMTSNNYTHDMFEDMQLHPQVLNPKYKKST